MEQLNCAEPPAVLLLWNKIFCFLVLKRENSDKMRIWNFKEVDYWKAAEIFHKLFRSYHRKSFKGLAVVLKRIEKGVLPEGTKNDWRALINVYCNDKIDWAIVKRPPRWLELAYRVELSGKPNKLMKMTVQLRPQILKLVIFFILTARD